jgi:hypothetical protein
MDIVEEELEQEAGSKEQEEGNRHEARGEEGVEYPISNKEFPMKKVGARSKKKATGKRQ